MAWATAAPSAGGGAGAAPPPAAACGLSAALLAPLCCRCAAWVGVWASSEDMEMSGEALVDRGDLPCSPW